MSNPRGKGWKCRDCGHDNDPVVCKLTSIPPLTCGGPGCTTQSSTSYEWRMTRAITTARTSRQQIHIDVPIYNQDGGNCALYATLVVVRLMWMLHYAWNHDAYLSVEPDALALADKYREVNEGTFPLEADGVTKVEVMFMPKVTDLIKKHGIPLKWSKYCLPVDPCRSIGIKSAIQLDLQVTTTQMMTELIANGIPLTGTVAMGRLFSLISCEEVYNGPELIGNQRPEGFHTVALIGSGLKPKPVEGTEPVHETFFVARDSAGHRAHPSTSRGRSDREEGVGGDFLVWRSDLLEVWKIEIVDNYLPI